MDRTHALALVAVLALAVVPGLAAAQMDISIASVEVTPSDPVPGDEITVETTVENLATNDAGYVVDRITIHEAGDDSEVYDDADDLGTIAVGQTKTVPLSVSFDEEGTYDLRVKVYGRSAEGGDRTVVQYPLTLRVRDRQPQLDVDANDTAVGVANDGSVTVANSLGSPIEDVELAVEGDDVAISNRREVLATVESGASRTIDFEYRPRTRGTHRVNATLSYTTAGGTSDTVTESVRIRAERVRPQLDIAVNDSVAGVESTGSVTVANAIGTEIRNVELTVGGRDVTVRDDREVFTRIANGDAVTSGFDFQPGSAGEHTLNATLSYTTGGGAVQTVSETVTVEAERLRDRVSLDVSTVQGGSSQTVVVDVFNQGNAPATNLSVRGSSPNASVGRVLLDSLAPGDSRTVRLNATLSADRADLAIAATYDLGDQRGETSVSTAVTQTPGTISLTGIQVVPEGGRLRVSGSASNLGTTDAQSVLVSVVGSDRVTPVEPNPEFFVGPVPASDFASFDVYASTEGNVSAIPLEISYIVDGTQRTRTVEVDATAASQTLSAEERAAARDSGGGGFPLIPVAVGLVVVLAVLAIIVQAWRTSRGGD
jgi:hypothetical protein